MMRYRIKSPRRSGLAPFSGAFLIVLLAAAWVALAPVPVGGRASYVIVNGNSMEPKFHLGDLVIVREGDGYRTGDIVAYRHPDIGPVIHRIVGREGDRFVFRGDNNSWLDSYHPRESELIGESWIEVPSAGKLIERLRGPVGLTIFSGMIGVIAMTSFVTTKGARRGPRRDQAPAEKKKGAASARPPGDGAEGMLTLLAAVMLASLLLGFFAFSRPTSVPLSEDAAYRHTGEFSYSADGMPYGIYDRSEAQTGEPVFRRLTETVSVAFDYRLATDQPTGGVGGTYRLVAEVSDVNGWRRTILLEPDTPFTGGQFTAQGVLELSEVQSVINRLEKRTGLHTDRYALSIVPEVYARGTLGGEKLDDEFSPRLDFWLDPLQLQLQTPTTTSADPLLSENTNPLKPSEGGSAKLSGTQPNTLPILGFNLSVRVARLVSLLGLALSLAGLLRIGIPVLHALQGDEPTRIRARYGQLLVSVSGGDPASGNHLIEVAAFEDLAKVAEGGGQGILHRTSEGIHDYYVQDSGATYHYRAVASEPGDGTVLQKAA